MADSERFSRIAGVAKRHVDAGALSGVEWKILRKGRVWAQGQYGFADATTGRAMADKPIYRIFSMTKPIVSAVAIMLIEQGKVRLFDPLSAHLPEFRNMEVLQKDGSKTPAKMITIEHLLTHRAGLSYGFLLDCPVAALYREANLRDAKLSLEGFAQKIAAMPLASQPGTKWCYSVATDILGRVLEVVLGKPLQEILSGYILAPLGLSDTAYSVPPENAERLMAVFGTENLDDCMVFDSAPQTLDPVDMSGSYPHDDPNYCRGGSGLFSTLDDYAVIAQFLQSGLAPDGTRLLSAKSIEMLWMDRIPDSQKPLEIGFFVMAGYGWGLGGRVMAKVNEAQILTEQGEAGWAGAASTFFWIDTKNDLIGVVMAQYIGSKIPIGEDFQTAVYQALEE